MLSKIAVLATAAQSHMTVTSQKDLYKLLKGSSPDSWRTVQKPMVTNGATQATCSTNVARLKAGPANIPEVITAGTAWTDTSWTGTDVLW